MRFHGAADVPLNDTGRAQVRRLVPVVAGECFAAVVHSPLSRARESAEILMAELKEQPAVVEVEAGLREIHFGRIEGMTREEIQAAYPEWYEEWVEDRIDRFPGGGDSIAGFWQRAGDALKEAVARHPVGDLLVVAHQGTIKAGIGRLCQIDRVELRTWSMDLGSLWVLTQAAGSNRWSVDRRNVVG